MRHLPTLANLTRAAVACVLLLMAAPAWAVIARRQVAQCNNSSGGSLQCTFAGAPLDGSVLTACVGRRDSNTNRGVTSISQAGVSWQAATSVTQSGYANVEIWYAKNTVSADPNMTVTVLGTTGTAVLIAEYTGARPVDVLNASYSVAKYPPGTANPATSGTLTTSLLMQDANAAIACFAADGSFTYSGQGAGWSEAIEQKSGSASPQISMALEDKIIAVKEDLVTPVTLSATPIYWVAQIIALRQQPPTQALTITPAGPGRGRITSTPAGLSCGATCSFGFDMGSSVSLSPVPVADSAFVGWSGDADCGDGVVAMPTDVNCTATFDMRTWWTLVVVKGGAGSGLVRSAGREIDCGAICSAVYIDRTIEWLNAYPDAGSVFAGWSGASCPIAGLSSVGTSIPMTNDRACTATFNLESGASVLYHVRSNGHDTNCNGLTNDATGAADPNCAFLTIGKAVGTFSCANGDDIRIHDANVYVEAVTFPSICQCPSRDDASNGPCVIQGDSSITVIDPGAGEAAITIGPGSDPGANASRNLLFRNMGLRCGTAAGLRSSVSKYVTDTTLLDMSITQMEQFGPKTNPPDAAVQFSASVSSADANILDGVVIDGDEAVCVNYVATDGARICGTDDGYGIYAGGTQGIDIRNSTVLDIQGQVGRTGSSAIIQNNLFRNIACELDTTDDGCWQLYNHEKVIFRRNLFDTVGPANNQPYAVIRMRRTSVPEGSSPVPPGMTVYNNTFWMPRSCSGPTSGCLDNSWGTGVRRNTITSASSGGGTQRPYGEMNIVRNVMADYIGTGSVALSASGFTGGGVNVCPGGAPGTTTLLWKGDIFSNDGIPPVISNSCPGTIEGYDASQVQISPGLDSNGKPTGWGEACFPFGTTFVARDGDRADDWVGYSMGACLALPVGCTDVIKNGLETDIDCGGSACPKCGRNFACLVDSDCKSSNCSALFCAAKVQPPPEEPW